MALAGPRLDRPSAIGDEGHPRTASLWLASLVVAVLVGVSGVVLGWPSLLPSLATLVGVTVVGVALLDRNRFIKLFAGHTLLILFGSVLVLIVVVAPFVDWVGLAVSGFSIALFGIAITWADVGDRDGLKRATVASVSGYVAMWMWLVALSVLVVVLWLTWVALSILVDASSPGAAVVSFLFVLGCSTIAIRLSLRWLPIRQLTPHNRRPVIEERLKKTRILILVLVIVLAGCFVTSALLWWWGWFAMLTLRMPVLADVFVALSSRWIVGPILAVGTLSLLVGAFAVLLRQFTRSTDVVSARRVSAGLTGLVLVLILIVSVLLTTSFVGILVLVVMLIAPVLLSVVLAVGMASIELGVLPDRAGGLAITAAGLVLAAIGFVNGPSVLVFACVAGATLVWDVSSFGLGLTAELGHLPKTRRLELFHAVLALGIAVIATIVAVGLDLLRTSVFAETGGTPALLVVALGALILLIPLRG